MSYDVDSLDPLHTPGTGTAGKLLSFTLCVKSLLCMSFEL